MSEVERLLLGGPQHGRRVSVRPEDRYLNVPVFRPPIFERADGPVEALGPDVVTYTLRRVPGADPVFMAPDFAYDSPEWLAFDTEAWVSTMVPGYVGWEHRGPWRWRGRHREDAGLWLQRMWVYVLLSDRADGYVKQLLTDEIVEDVADVDDMVFGDLQHEIDHRLPICVVPGCTEKGRAVLKAAEDGRLAGRAWRTGDEIRLCPPHQYDVLRSAGAYGVDELAEWLRPDVTLPDDMWSLEAALHWGADSQLRSLRVAFPMKGTG